MCSECSGENAVLCHSRAGGLVTVISEADVVPPVGKCNR